MTSDARRHSPRPQSLQSTIGGFGLQALEYGENVTTMLFDAPKAHHFESPQLRHELAR